MYIFAHLTRQKHRMITSQVTFFWYIDIYIYFLTFDLFCFSYWRRAWTACSSLCYRSSTVYWVTLTCLLLLSNNSIWRSWRSLANMFRSVYSLLFLLSTLRTSVPPMIYFSMPVPFQEIVKTEHSVCILIPLSVLHCLWGVFVVVHSGL